MRERLIRRWRALRRKTELERQLDEELRYHLDRQTEQNVAAGMSSEEAKSAALRTFGNLALSKEHCREARGVRFVEDCWQDFRYGARMLRQHAGFTLIAVLTLGLGVGANTAIFSVVNGVLLKPLPFPDPERLVIVREGRTEGGDNISYPNFLDVREQASSFAATAVYYSTDATLTKSGEPPERLSCAVVSANIFDILGASPIVGRAFLPEEDKLGGGPTDRPLILSQAFWRRRFNHAADVLGKQVTLNGKSYTVVGVMPESFQFPVRNETIDLWTTVAVDADPELYGGSIPTSRGYPHYEGALARLKDGVTVDAAQAELAVLAGNIRQENAWLDRRWKLFATPALDQIVGDVRLALLILLGAVGLVLAVACVNIANLLVARTTLRGKELAVRTALGASRMRLARQMLTESLMLAGLGAAVGLTLALWGVGFLTSVIPDDFPRVAEVGVDWRVGIFTFSISLLAGAAFGTVPALLGASRVDLTGALKEGGRDNAVGRTRRLTRGALITLEVALAIVLLVGAGLLLRSFVRLLRVDPGFETGQLLTFRVSLPEHAYPQGSAQIKTFYDRLLGNLRHTPGVQAASIAQALPLSGHNNSTSVTVEGDAPPAGEKPSADLRFVGLDYFRTMAVELTGGRDFTARDDAAAPSVVIVNDAFVRRFLSDGRALNRKLTTGWGGSGPKEIIGVVRDVKHRGLDENARPEMYVPVAQFPINEMTVVVRTQVEPQSLSQTAQRAVRALDPDLPVYDVRTLDQYVSRSVARPRFNALLIGLFAVLALALAAVGVYGIVTHSVAERTREIGVRMALGARAPDVLLMVIKHGMRPVLIGAAIGLALAVGLARVMLTLLYDTNAYEPIVYAVVALLLICVALAACYVPARRATRIDPLDALRAD